MDTEALSISQDETTAVLAWAASEQQWPKAELTTAHQTRQLVEAKMAELQ